MNFSSPFSCMACMGPVFYELPDGSAGNAFQCDMDLYDDHVHACISCTYTYYRTRLLAHPGVPLACFDPACSRSYDLDGTVNVAKSALSADEFMEFLKMQRERLNKQGEASRARAVDEASKDSLHVLLYAVHNTQRCPACCVRLEKIDGCDEVRCQNCGHVFQFSEAFNFIDHNELKLRRNVKDAAAKAKLERDMRAIKREVSKNVV